MYVLGIGERYRGVAEAIVRAPLAAARAGGFHGMSLEHPIADVDGVYILLHDNVAAEHFVMDPVAQPVHVRRSVGMRGIDVIAVIVGSA